MDTSIEKPTWIKRLVLFMASQTVSLLGSMLVAYAIMWYVALETLSGVSLLIFALCQFVPSLLLTPFAGVWADRLNRKGLMIVADLGIAAVTLLMAVLFLFGIKDLWIIFVITAVRAFGQTIHSPTVSAVYQQIVPEDKLVKVQGIAQGIQSTVQIALPALAAVLLNFWSIEYIFFIDVITAAIAVYMLITIVKLPKHKAELLHTSIDYFKDIKAGFKYIGNHKFLLSILIFSFIYMFMVAAPSYLTYIQVARVFGNEQWRLAILEIIFGVGLLSGSLLISFFGGFKNRLITFFVSYLIIGLGCAALGVPFSFWFYIIAWGVIGLFIGVSNPLFMGLIQEKVDPAFIGRVFSVIGLINALAMPLGIILFGPLSDTIDISLVILGTGIAMVFISIVPFFNKPLLKEGLRAEVKKSEIENTKAGME